MRIWFSKRSASDRALDLSGTQATSADIHSFRSTVLNDLDFLEVRFPSSVGPSVGMGNLISKLDFFVTAVTSCHVLRHLLFYRQATPVSNTA